MKRLLIVGIIGMLCMSFSSTFGTETDYSYKTAFVDNDQSLNGDVATFSVIGDEYDFTTQPMLHSVFSFEIGPMAHGGAYLPCISNAIITGIFPYNTRAGPDKNT